MKKEKAGTLNRTLLTIQRDGLGHRAVRLVDGRLVFTDPADRAWAAGHWRITLLASNKAPASVTALVPPSSTAHGRAAA